jgi:transposase
LWGTAVAMESTGVYWIPPYDVLEQHGVKPCLVDARAMENVPGRRTDCHEGQWIQFLNSVGLRRMRKVHNRAGALFRMAAYSLHHD